MRIKILVLFLVALFTSCIDDLGVFSSEEQFLIVEGSITSEPKSHAIKIAVSQQFNTTSDYSRVEYADVYLIDDLGSIIQLTYGGDGKYYTESDFAARVGRSYQLKILLQDGTSVVSSFETVVEPVGITNTYYKIESEEFLSEENVLSTRQVVVFYADFQDSELNENFYRWDYEELFKVLAPLVGSGAGGTTLIGRGNCPRVTPKKDCWAKQRAGNYLNLSSDAFIGGEMVEGHRVYSTTIGRKFAEGFSTQIRLLSLNKGEFEFWNEINDQLGNKGTLFEKSNYQIKGNLTVESSDELVLGYFGVTSVSTSNVYIAPSDLNYSYEYICEPNEYGCYPQACLDCTAYSNSSETVAPISWPWN